MAFTMRSILLFFFFPQALQDAGDSVSSDAAKQLKGVKAQVLGIIWKNGKTETESCAAVRFPVYNYQHLIEISLNFQHI